MQRVREMRFMMVKSPIRVVILVVPHDDHGRMSPKVKGKLCLGICGGQSTSPPTVVHTNQ
jgi:hypothetical protein